jgi:uncharacterized protein YggE
MTAHFDRNYAPSNSEHEVLSCSVICQSDLEERVSDFEKAREMLLTAKVELQGKLDAAENDAKKVEREAEKRAQEVRAKLEEAKRETEMVQTEMVS